MNYQSVLAAAVLLASLSACGGGGGGGSSNPPPAPPPPPPPPPRIDISLSADSETASLGDSDTEYVFAVTATSVVTGTIDTPIVPDVVYDEKIFSAVDAVPGSTPNSYIVTARTHPDLDKGVYQSQISFRLCHQASCTQVYAGSRKTYTLNLTVKTNDWSMYQRDGRHKGYVPVKLNPKQFEKIWEWKNTVSGLISPAVTGDGKAYITSSALSGDSAKVYAFDELTGAQEWAYEGSSQNPFFLFGMSIPAYRNGKVYIPSYSENMYPGSASISVISSLNGNIESRFSVSSKYAMQNSPVFSSGSFYYFDGQYTQRMHRFNLISGSADWVVDVDTPRVIVGALAADDKYIYKGTGLGVVVYDKITGAYVKTVEVNRFSDYMSTDFSAPVVVANGRVLSRIDQSNNYGFGLFDIPSGKLIWEVEQHVGQPVVANDVVILGDRNNTINVYSISDGSLLWSWEFPLGEFYQHNYNMVVTDNILFVSGRDIVFALDLNKKTEVWSYPSAGNLSLSGNNILYISTNYGSSDKGLTAIKLK